MTDSKEDVINLDQLTNPQKKDYLTWLGGVFDSPLHSDDKFVKDIKNQFLKNPHELIECDKPDKWFGSDIFEDIQFRNRYDLPGIQFIRSQDTFLFWFHRVKFVSFDLLVMAIYNECYEIADKIYNKMLSNGKVTPDNIPYSHIRYTPRSPAKNVQKMIEMCNKYKYEIDLYYTHIDIYIHMIKTGKIYKITNPMTFKYPSLRTLRYVKTDKPIFITGEMVCLDDCEYLEELSKISNIKFTMRKDPWYNLIPHIRSIEMIKIIYKIYGSEFLDVLIQKQYWEYRFSKKFIVQIEDWLKETFESMKSKNKRKVDEYACDFE